MGVSVAEGTIAVWRKRAGDWVERDETIVEISTDKIETEIPSPASGRVTEILVEVGVTVPVGEVLARIDTGSKPGQAHADETPLSPRAVDIEPPTPISPVVRRMAAEHHLDLGQIEGTGMRGRITKRDVMRFIEQLAAPEGQPMLHMESPYREDEPTPEPTTQSPESGVESPGSAELSQMRKRIGEHMRRSLDTAAHCTTIVEVDMSRIEAARAKAKLSYLPFVARCVIDGLREYPRLNAWLEGDRFTMHQDVNLGIAVSLGEDGLIVPVIHGANELSHEGIARRIKELASRARDKQLAPDDVQGGTFTITNPGAFGALLATPIINQPQVAILDLEAVVKRPVVVSGPDGDSIAIRPMSYLCMSWDHRALDGVYAAQFLSDVRRRLESW
jgi:2-oxoglutarate dehydrogenase E2 component (dihydrolipoamide succinyltransferase)